jgi:hypothetical protein
MVVWPLLVNVDVDIAPPHNKIFVTLGQVYKQGKVVDARPPPSRKVPEG